MPPPDFRKYRLPNFRRLSHGSIIITCGVGELQVHNSKMLSSDMINITITYGMGKMTLQCLNLMITFFLL